ncbi:hypothetical protein GGX14DRAFT_568046 [Mycena pura]|uniref:Uncharacterized protein n=1 Tax=Mycena pura TaxID=153505 RepID=A0AAD6V936_9AGAR|nr:hypothetical protein GGX14DRAFT_568046 [Mycena pura]
MAAAQSLHSCLLAAANPLHRSASMFSLEDWCCQQGSAAVVISITNSTVLGHARAPLCTGVHATGAQMDAADAPHSAVPFLSSTEVDELHQVPAVIHCAGSPHTGRARVLHGEVGRERAVGARDGDGHVWPPKRVLRTRWVFLEVVVSPIKSVEEAVKAWEACGRQQQARAGRCRREPCVRAVWRPRAIFARRAGAPGAADAVYVASRSPYVPPPPHRHSSISQ